MANGWGSTWRARLKVENTGIAVSDLASCGPGYPYVWRGSFTLALSALSTGWFTECIWSCGFARSLSAQVIDLLPILGIGA